MISTKIFSRWNVDPENPAIALAIREINIQGSPVNFTVRVPIDPHKKMNPEKPLHVQYVFRKPVRVWQPQ